MRGFWIPFNDIGEEGELPKKYVRNILDSLEEHFHHIYALFLCCSPDVFSIRREPDGGVLIRRKRLPRLYTVEDFRLNYQRFTDSDRFSLLFNSVNLNFDYSCTTKTIEVVYKSFLYDQCERAIYANRPFSLTKSQVIRYGLTPSDALRVRSLIHALNGEIIQALQTDYDTLKNLLCIRK